MVWALLQPLYTFSPPPCRTTIAHWPANFFMPAAGWASLHSGIHSWRFLHLPSPFSLLSLCLHFIPSNPSFLSPISLPHILFSVLVFPARLSLCPSLWLCVSAEAACFPSSLLPLSLSLSLSLSEPHSHTNGLNCFINLPLFSFDQIWDRCKPQDSPLLPPPPPDVWVWQLATKVWS